METLASIGVLAIIFGLLYLYLSGIDKKEHDRLYYWKLSDYDDECIKIKKYTNSADLDNEFKRIFSDPVKRNTAIAKMKEKELIYKQDKERFRHEQAESRKFGYKYEDMIFDIFDNYRKLLKKDIIWCMENYYSFNKLEAENIFNSWLKHQLIKKDYINDGFFEIGVILNLNSFKLTQNDITRDEWLELHNKKLQSIDNEYDFFKYKKFIFMNTYSIEEGKAILNSKVLKVKELKPEELSVLNDQNEVVGILCSANKPLEQMTKPVISLIQPIIHQVNGSFVADMTKEPFYLIHQLVENHDIVISEF